MPDLEREGLRHDDAGGTEMIRLREFTKGDIASIARHANNLNVVRYMSHMMPNPYTRDDAKWWVKVGCRQVGLNRAIDLDGECVGVVGVRFGEHERLYSAEIGYWLGEAFWGRGIMTRAVSEMTQAVFDETEVVRLSAPVYSPNGPSMRVLEKCGYALEAIHKAAIFKNGEFLDEHLYVKFK